MCWWAQSCSCTSKGCTGTSLFDIRQIPIDDLDCPASICTNQTICNTSGNRRLLPSDEFPLYKRFCRSCLGRVPSWYRLPQPSLEIQCLGCQARFGTEDECKIHVTTDCEVAEAKGDMWNRMMVKIRDVPRPS